ncbi:DinB family protein [Winogradskyella echinorum]|uniref:DinB family protein n=1 Tax=Winogradskyella echinorum TaxID=538189 RepID=A0ABR6XYN6_9FLAO|nr:DinB family protein [Winogradskyella echinorum]MBC3845617.1 DinB family protein [Winogradskyella echinorum]MBC5749965.1 DinB family protein [Winogradskyella echinorum]
MDWSFDIAIKNRKLLKSFIENHTLEELNKVPEGFSNNIIWNIAHTIVTQQLLVYNLSGLPMIVSDEMVAAFRKGTKTERDLSEAEVDTIKGLLFSTIEKTKEDYDNKIFQIYNQYTVTTKSILSNVEEAIDFNNFHEGIHLGYILAIRKSL